MANTTLPIMTDATGMKIYDALQNAVISSSDIVDNLTTADPSKALSANMGKNLADGMNSNKRNIGELVFSSIPILGDSGLKLANGQAIARGAYTAFYDYIVSLYNASSNAVVSYADWQTERTANGGSIGKYGYDSTNARVYLPDLTNTFVEPTADSSALGEFMSAGLPNITGNFGQIAYIHDEGDTNGAFNLGNMHGTLANGSWAYGRNVSFDASRSTSTGASAVYGNSTTVQPQAVKQYVYIVVANSVKPDYVIDIDEVMTDVNANTSAIASLNNITVNNVGAISGVSDIAIFQGQQYIDFAPLTEGLWLIELTYNADCHIILCKNSSFVYNFAELGNCGGTAILKITESQTVVQLYINTDDTSNHTFYRWGYNFVKLK